MDVKFIGSYDEVEKLPRARTPEYAFIGRSNVGKSSLLNALVGHRVARTSNTPGRTRLINMFEWNNIMLADLPGYGYARASKTDIIHWMERLEQYLKNRSQLERLFILVDARHGLKETDIEMMDFCNKCAIKFQIVLTKCDKSNKAESEKRKAEIEEYAKKSGVMSANVISTSADKKWGIEELREELRV